MVGGDALWLLFLPRIQRPFYSSLKSLSSQILNSFFIRLVRGPFRGVSYREIFQHVRYSKIYPRTDGRLRDALCYAKYPIKSSDVHSSHYIS